MIEVLNFPPSKKFSESKPSRYSIQPKNFDYSQPGGYFVTVCIQNRRCLLGKIRCGKLKLNEIGKMVEYEWKAIKKRFNFIESDNYIIMPNHFHAIIIIPPLEKMMLDPLRGTDKNSVGRIVQAFKSITTVQYINGVKNRNWPSFNRTLWQRNYHEHIIRDGNELSQIQEYIQTNPSKWKYDDHYSEEQL